MKRIAGLSILILVFLFAALVPAQESKGPKIEAKELKHDFGKVVQGTQATHVFEVRNTGEEPLIIERVQTSWGCTAAVISSDHLDPGNAGQIKASVDTTGKTGRLEKHVSVYSNDRINPVITLSLIMDIVQK